MHGRRTIKKRDEVINFHSDLVSWLERNSVSNVKREHSDGAEKFTAMKKTLRTKYIPLTTSLPYSLRSNRLSGHKNRNLLGKARSSIKESGLDRRYWREVATHAASFIAAWTAQKNQITHIKNKNIGYFTQQFVRTKNWTYRVPAFTWKKKAFGVRWSRSARHRPEYPKRIV